jgi:hypothetical protein
MITCSTTIDTDNSQFQKNSDIIENTNVLSNSGYKTDDDASRHTPISAK